MSKSKDNSTAKSAPNRGGLAPDHETGLPWLHSWRGVYVFVFSIFLLWLGLLTWLTEYYTA